MNVMHFLAQSLRRTSIVVVGSLCCTAAGAEATHKLSFLPQTGVVPLEFADRSGEVLALAGRELARANV